MTVTKLPDQAALYSPEVRETPRPFCRCGPNGSMMNMAWGGVLMKQGHASDALEKFDEAVKFAPKWQKLQQARELALKGGRQVVEIEQFQLD